ncbi:MAG TPA: hypothetical protein VND65_05805 [Candidatus Binatia bacterium]|nr:hypothetical protein [Candidatus Binatia bacterium]
MLLFLLCLFLGCHLVLFSLPFFMERRNDVQLQLIDCIESLKIEVKKKMHVLRRAMLYQSHRKRKNARRKFARRSAKCISAARGSAPLAVSAQISSQIPELVKEPAGPLMHGDLACRNRFFPPRIYNVWLRNLRGSMINGGFR